MQTELKELMKILDESLTKPNLITQYLNQNEQLYKSFSTRERKNGKNL